MPLKKNLPLPASPCKGEERQTEANGHNFREIL